MKEQTVFEGPPAQPTLIADEPAREVPAVEVSIDGMCGVY
ncbi:MAG TPA: mycofactocin precursor MftA [Streptosporangiaceae bacterium]